MNAVATTALRPNVAATGGTNPNAVVVTTPATGGGAAAVATSGVQPVAGTAQPAYALQQQAGATQQVVNTAAASNGQGVMPGATNGATAATGFAAGLGTFNFYGVTATAFNCLRSGTRVFCDFDETSQSNKQLPAGWWIGGAKLVLSNGRVFSTHVAHYVDVDGSTFDTAELSPNTPVRLILEYDDVPAQYTTVGLAAGNDKISAVPVTDMPATQSPNMIAPRQVQQQQGQAQAAAATDPNAAAASTADKVSQGMDKVNSTKSAWGNILKKAKTMTQTQPQNQ